MPTPLEPTETPLSPFYCNDLTYSILLCLHIIEAELIKALKEL